MEADRARLSFHRCGGDDDRVFTAFVFVVGLMAFVIFASGAAVPFAGQPR